MRNKYQLGVVPAVPKFHRTGILLKEHEWEEGHNDGESFRAVSTTVGTDPTIQSHNVEA
jgi:hypothetical protein